ncbi:dihydroneopterin aldolase [Sulfurimonas sp.]
MQIHIENLTFKCIIGILEFERKKSQKVMLNIKLDYQYKKEFINYAEIVELVKSRMKKKKFFLIEDALEDLSKNIKKKFPQTNRVNLKITKPSILPDCEVSVSNTFSF